MLTDYHVHSHYSDDCEYPMESVVQDAICLGLDEICFTEHVDYGIKRDRDDPRGIQYRPGGPGEPEWMAAANPDYPRYADQLQQLKQRYAGQITLKMGMEFGIQPQTIPQYEALFSQYPFDFILLSVHQIGNQELWNQDYQSGRTQAESYLGYYETLLSLVQNYRNYSVLAHMDLISRYDQQGGFPFQKVKPLVAEILKTVIETGKGIEVNTSSHRYGLADMTPSREILCLYRDLGGHILTIGSDSHKKTHLGAHIRQTHQALEALGFRHFYTYDKMVPQAHPL